MDIAAKLREAVSQIPDGEYMSGLRAVVRHIDAAINHFERAQSTEDDDAFTDSIYRTNQAYEGSLKEAFRVISGEDPFRKTLFDIENYFQGGHALRARVLTQMKRYREDYRNPSTHDYKLDFDENESLLAILSVSAFAKLLVDQIGAKVEFDKIKKDIIDSKEDIKEIFSNSPKRFFEELSKGLLDFLNYSSREGMTERENNALITAYLSSSNIRYVEEYHHSGDPPDFLWDIVVIDTNENVIPVEIRSSRGRQSPDITIDRIATVADWMRVSKFDSGILIEGAARGDEYICEGFDLPGVLINRIGKGLPRL